MSKLTRSQRAWNFYQNKIYDNNYLNEYGLFDDTTEIFNPVPKTAFIMNALTLQKEIQIELNEEQSNEDQSSQQFENNQDQKLNTLKSVWKNNNFQNMKYTLLLWLILTQEVVVELNKRNNNIIFTLHNPDNVETEYMNGELVYAKIKGETKKFNKENREFETVTITKEYYNVDGYRYIIENSESNLIKDKDEVPLAFEFIPVVEIETDYDLQPLFDITDHYNEIEAYLNNVFYLHGDPLIWDNLSGKQFSKKDKENKKEGRYKEQTVAHLGKTDAKMQYLEMQGNVAQLMLEKQDKLEDIISNDYPEYVLATMLSKGDPSGDALKIKGIEIESRIDSLRGDIESGIIKIDNMALRMLGRSELDHSIHFGEIFPDSLKELVDIVTSLREIKFISRETGMKKFPQIIEDPEEELKKVNQEQEEELNSINQSINQELSEDAHTQD